MQNPELLKAVAEWLSRDDMPTQEHLSDLAVAVEFGDATQEQFSEIMALFMVNVRSFGCLVDAIREAAEHSMHHQLIHRCLSYFFADELEWYRMLGMATMNDDGQVVWTR